VSDAPPPAADARAASEQFDGTDAPASYEAARQELADIVRRLEAGSQSLEESLQLWERGEQLAELCQRWLDGARARLDASPTAPDTSARPSDAD
jgi:exodeoxyribonuclease VII small subunit